MQRLRRRRRHGADGPDAGDAVVGPLAGVGRHEGQPGRQQVGDLDVGGGVGAAVGQGDREGDVSPTLGVALLTVLVRARSACCGVSVALAVLLPVSGSNWSLWLMVAVLVCAVGLATRACDASASAAPPSRPCRPSTCRWRCRRCPGWAWPTQGQAGRQQVGHLHAGGRVGPLLVSVTVKVIDVADVGRRVADRLGHGQVGLLRRLGGAGAVVAGVGVELVGAG